MTSLAVVYRLQLSTDHQWCRSAAHYMYSPQITKLLTLMWVWKIISQGGKVDLVGKASENMTLIVFFFTFDISIPLFPIGQVHVDICTQLWSAGGEHTKDFVLIKSSFLQTADESSLFQMQAMPHPQYATNPKPQNSDYSQFAFHPVSLRARKCVGSDSKNSYRFVKLRMPLTLKHEIKNFKLWACT